MTIVGFSISQWFPCPLAIWGFGLDGKYCQVSEQCGFAASKGIQIIRLIRRNIAHKENELRSSQEEIKLTFLRY